MKKSVLAMAVFGVIANAAQAQSNITMYGLIDQGLNYTNDAGGHSQFAMSSGDAIGSTWGLKGSEDLGGGLSSVFTLEGGFIATSGELDQEGQLFGRQAFVGLASTSYGKLTFGRQYDSLVDDLAPLTANGSWGGGMFSHPYDNDNTDDSFRLNNAVKYTSADYGGLSFTGAYASSNTGAFALNRAESVAAQYQYGGLTAAAAYLYVDTPNANETGAVVIGPNGTADGSWTATHQQVFGAGVNYTVGSATVGLVYTHSDIKQPTSTGYADLAASPTLGSASALKFDNVEFNGTYRLTPAFLLGAMYTYTQMKYDGKSGNATAKYHQFGMMADYNLSKRTDVYVQGAYVHIADASGVAGTGLDVASNPDANSSSSTSSQFMARVALRHQF